VSRPPEPIGNERREAVPADPLRLGFRIAYPAGLALCVAWPLLLQLLLGGAIRPGAGPLDETARQLGYSFTGLTLASAVFIARRWKRTRAGFAALAASRRGPVLVREVLLYSVLCTLSSLFGIVYFAMGGAEAERYARAFIVLTSVMFFVFVPRLQAWREAAQGE
jgi:hypothetical protein